MSSVISNSSCASALPRDELHGGDRLVHVGEAELRARGFAIERQARACRSRRPSPAGSCDARACAAAGPAASSRNLSGETAGPQRHRARHRLLHVGVAGQRDVAFARRQRVERSGATLPRPPRSSRDRVAQIEPQRGEHLVVARAAEMHAAAGGADARGEPLLERGLAVFVGELDLPLPGGVLVRRWPSSPSRMALQVRVRQQLLRH